MNDTEMVHILEETTTAWDVKEHIPITILQDFYYQLRQRSPVEDALHFILWADDTTKQDYVLLCEYIRRRLLEIDPGYGK